MRIIHSLVIAFICSFAAVAVAQEARPEAEGEQFKTLSGMSVLGNNEAPKSLVIVPWKSSTIGDGIGVVNSLDNRPVPVDREVFSRELNYYHIRTGSTQDPETVDAESLRVGSR